MSKWRYIMGSVTIVVIVGSAIYAIKKSKDAEKAEGEVITLADARAEVEARKQQNSSYMSPTKSYKESIRSRKEELLGDFTPIRRASDDKFDEPFEHDDEIDYEEGHREPEGPDKDDTDTEQPTNDTIIKEENEVRYEPNSNDARIQYIKMELAEWEPLEDTYQLLLKLFEFPFEPRNDGDADLRSNIVDFRTQFFGFNSRWTQEVTIADVILHYARAAQYNCNESVRYWVEYFLEFNEIDLLTPSHEIDEWLISANNHVYFNEERQTFGLFGLTRESMDQAIRIANRNIDRSVTYEIEFNEFLKSCI